LVESISNSFAVDSEAPSFHAFGDEFGDRRVFSV